MLRLAFARRFAPPMRNEGISLLATCVRMASSDNTTERVPQTPSMDRIWELWSEGNLFSLHAADLTLFLQANGVEIDAQWKKTQLVKQVENIVSAKKNPSLELGGSSKDVAALKPGKDDAISPADTYGEVAAEAFEGKDQMFVDVQQAGLYSGDTMGPIIPRAFQLMHESICPNVYVSRLKTHAFPGSNGKRLSFTLARTDPYASNNARFHKAFQWSVMNLWNMNMDGEINIGVGKLLLWKGAHKGPRKHMTLWSAQQQLQADQPFSWLGIAHPDNVADVERYCAENGWKEQGSKVSYRVSVKRQKEFLEGEAGADAATVSLSRSWERFLLTFYLRDAMPDVRLQLRARLPLKKKTAEAFSATSLIRIAKDGTVTSGVPPELGEVVYVVERTARTWKKLSKHGLPLTLTEAKTRVVLSKGETREPRLEYEVGMNVPSSSVKMKIGVLAEELWGIVVGFPQALTPGMAQYGCVAKEE